MTHPYREELAGRLDPIIADHLRLASWNRGKDRPARVAYHHDAVLTLREAAAALRQSPTVEEVARVIAAADGVTWDGRTVTYASAGDDDEGPTERYFRAAQAIDTLYKRGGG